MADRYAELKLPVGVLVIDYKVVASNSCICLMFYLNMQLYSEGKS